MKLLMCSSCHDVQALQMEERTCKCGVCSGYYIDGHAAVVKGTYAVVLRLPNDQVPFLLLGGEVAVKTFAWDHPRVRHE
jgi:hypothetical protein